MISLKTFENPIFTSLVFPFVVAVLTALGVKFLNRKKNKTELTKLGEEIKKIKTSYQPIVLNSLQTIQSELFKDKVNSLKELINSKLEIFNVEQFYHEGNPIIEDTYDYYQNIYIGLSDVKLKNIQANSLNNGNLFPSKIRDKFQKLVENIYEINNIQKREFSLQNQNMPNDIEEKLKNTLTIYDDLIELIRSDLHFDNTFIHDFIREYQK